MRRAQGRGDRHSTWEALVNTIPAHRRDRVRAFLTGVPTQLGTIVAGAVALIVQRFDEPRVLYGAGLVGSPLAVASISRIRSAYPRALVAALREGRPTIFATAGGPAGCDRECRRRRDRWTQGPPVTSEAAQKANGSKG